MNICCNCAIPVREEYQCITLSSYRKEDDTLKEIKENHIFCSLICHSIWVLQDTHDYSVIFGDLDSSWYPVIRQLVKELEKSL